MKSTRRVFLQRTVGASSLLSFAPAIPAVLARSAAAASEHSAREGTVLVVVQMSGGNDSLNTVVPYADDVYHRSRPTLRAVARNVHKLNDYLGLHPRAEALARLYEQGQLAIVHGLGYPNNDRGHPGAMRDWHTARPHDPQCQTGWLGRVLDEVTDPENPAVYAAALGLGRHPLALNATHAYVPAVNSLEQLRMFPTIPPGRREAVGEYLQQATAARRSSGNPLVHVVQRSLLAAQDGSRKIEQVLATGNPQQGYPEFPLAHQLAMVSALMRAEVGIRVFFTVIGGNDIGGFDNHANQLGNHGALLHELSESIAAFARDLQRHRLLDRVLLFTFSEFGRTLRENGRRGTDHGAAASHFVLGGQVKAGMVGKHPSLTDEDQNALRVHTDFRRLYATALERWLGVDSREALGGHWDPIDLLRS